MNRRNFLQIATAAGGSLAMGSSAAPNSPRRVALHTGDAPLLFEAVPAGAGHEMGRILVSPSSKARMPGLGGGILSYANNEEHFLGELRQYDCTISVGEDRGSESFFEKLIEASHHVLVIGPLSERRGAEFIELARKNRTRFSLALPDASWIMPPLIKADSARIHVDLGWLAEGTNADEWRFGCQRAFHAAIHVLGASLPTDEFLAGSMFHVPAQARGVAPIHHMASLRFKRGHRVIRIGSVGLSAGSSVPEIGEDKELHLDVAWQMESPLVIDSLFSGALTLYDPWRDTDHSIQAERIFSCCMESMSFRGREVMMTGDRDFVG